MQPSLPEGPAPASDVDRHVLKCASEADRRWFENRPGREYRFRPVRRGEGFDGLGGDWVIVRQVAPGLRLRRVVRFPGGTSRKLVARGGPTTDAEIRAAWETGLLSVRGVV